MKDINIKYPLGAVVCTSEFDPDKLWFQIDAIEIVETKDKIIVGYTDETYQKLEAVQFDDIIDARCDDGDLWPDWDAIKKPSYGPEDHINLKSGKLDTVELVCVTLRRGKNDDVTAEIEYWLYGADDPVSEADIRCAVDVRENVAGTATGAVTT